MTMKRKKKKRFLEKFLFCFFGLGHSKDSLAYIRVAVFFR